MPGRCPVSPRLVLALAAVPLLGLAPGPSPGWPPDASLVRYPDEIIVPQSDTTQEALRRGHAGVRDFLKGRPSWKATVDPYSGSVDRAFGDGMALGAAAGEAAARGFISRHRGLLAAGIDLISPSGAGTTLLFNERASRPLSGTGSRVLQFDLFKDGLPVMGSGLSLGERDGRVVLIASRALTPVAASSRPTLDAAEALEAVSAFLEGNGQTAGPLAQRREPALAFTPRLERRGGASLLRHHLVWVLQVKPEEAPFYQWYVAWVDAHDGQVLALFPEAPSVSSCAADPNQARATVLGGVRPNRADDPEQVLSFPFARVEVNGALVDADLNGRFPFGGGTVASGLAGRFFKVHCDDCTSPPEPAAAGGPSGDIDFGTAGASSSVPIAGNGASTPADRSAYFHLNQARLLLGKWDNAFFDEIDAFTNLNSTCNAFSSSYMLGFFIGGGNCHNTAEIRDVVQHELGHTWDRTDGNDITSGSMSEWKGDLLALAMGGDSCIAESFRLSGGPSATCSGVRDIDEAAPGRTDHPLTPAVCPTCATLTRSVNGCGGEVHCVGEIPGQASWHLLNNLLAGADYITGAALPAGNPPIPSEHARWLLERLLMAGGPPMQTFNPAAAGVSIYDAMMLVDDDDANLANGTPHAAYINDAFVHHEIAETPPVGDSANCAPLSDPTVTASLETDAATGLPAVRLTWTPVGGATSFDVLRNTRSGDAFIALARNVASGPVLDTGVQVGATYRYFVAAVRRTGCAAISPGTNIVAVAVQPPDLKVGTTTISEVPGASDGDGLIEPGEEVSVQISLREVGGFAPATGVTAIISSSSAASPVSAGGPVAYGTVPASGSVAGAAAFRVVLGPSEVCGGRVHLIVSASGDQGCWQDAIDVPIDATGSCSVSASAMVEVVPGSVLVVGGGGDGDGIPDNCETTTVSYQVRNSGSIPSGPATATVSSPQPGVTFAPAPSCAVANLNGGASAACGFAFSLGGAAAAAGIPFVLTADSAGNSAPSTVQVVLGAESNPPVFSTVGFGFDGALQGWTAQQFSLSTTRVFSGTHSAHAGSTTTPNICGHLTSPPLLLNPSGSSTLSFRLFADVEPLTDQWYDRANVHIVDLASGKHTLVAPSSGPAYPASGNEQGGLCHIAGENGWAGALGGFSAVTFDLSAFAGRSVRVEINYGSDEGDDREGIYIDDVAIANATSAPTPADLQGDACVVPEVSPPAAAVRLDVQALPGNIYRLTWQDLGPGFQYNLYAGAAGSYYSHGAGPLSCSGLGAGMSCDGTTCTLDEAAAGLPAGSDYFLVTATAFGVEGNSGFASNLTERGPSQSTCAP